MSLLQRLLDVGQPIALLVVGGAAGFAISQQANSIHCEIASQYATSPPLQPSRLARGGRQNLGVQSFQAVSKVSSQGPKVPPASKIGSALVRNVADMGSVHIALVRRGAGAAGEFLSVTIRAGEQSLIDLPYGNFVVRAREMNRSGAAFGVATSEHQLRIASPRTQTLVFHGAELIDVLEPAPAQPAPAPF